MKKIYMILPLILILCFMVSCQDEEATVKRIMEDGVEVIINHLEPHIVKGEPSTFHIEKEFVIDTEMDEIASLGLTDMGAFDVDSKGNIYLVNLKSSENIIFKFDRDGNFVRSFCRKGQGPGELQMTAYLRINSQDEIMITELYNKLLVFNADGDFINETRFSALVTIGLAVIPINNSNYLILWGVNDPSAEFLFQRPLSLFSSEFEEIKRLDSLKVPNYLRGKRVSATYLFAFSLSKEHIFVGNDNRGYEIWVYDLEGNLARKIRKEYKKVPLTKEYIEEYMKVLDSQRKEMTDFPESFPPYQAFFMGDKGQLFVMTYEKGEDSGEYVFDIFNEDGLFIGRKSLRVFFDFINEGFLWATVKQNHLYCRDEKENGFKKLVVYKMTWE
ncbi:MAG: 6-bladed beta-propeller [Candidatus Aminicenantes bacterium]|nr:6-bladed beta-propeller [Candidatus Aminicenantes bacterium]MDH5742510.1 6-bladed beta-propeller [Candidatus Aminicenantes bacterium]